MVKADVKHNYYADLELPTSASLDDIRKAYRKLALQYHPDRNSGNEDQCVPKFQAIQAANEVLGDPGSKQKYDIDRRKAGLYPMGQTFNPRQPAPGNPYAANSAFPPPQRRTQAPPFQRPFANPSAAPGAPPGVPPGPPPNGADRFSNFPRPSPTARKDPAQDRTNAFKAWQNMNTAQERQQRFNQPGPQPPPPQPQTGRPRPPPPPPPPRQEPKPPTEEQIRAGMKYRNVPRFDPDNVDKNQSAWSSFQQSNSGRPGMPRTDTGRTPRKQGFNPNAPGSDEKPAGSHHVHRHKSEDFGRHKPNIRVPPQSGVPPRPPPPPGVTPTTPISPISPTSQRPHADPTRPFSNRGPDDQVPYSEKNRYSTPYTSFIHERTDLGDGLRRSYSTRDTTKLGPDDAANRSRARSTSPMGRQRAGEGHANAAGRKKPFAVYESSDGSATDLDMAQSPDNVETPSFGDQQRPGTAPNTKHPFERPKKVPTPRLNGSRNGPTSPPPMPNMPNAAGNADGAQSDREHPNMQQRTASNNMYADPSSLPGPKSSPTHNFGSLSTRRARQTWSSAGGWAIPSSVNPFFNLPKSGHAVSSKAKNANYVTAADELYTKATKWEQNAYLRFQAELQKEYEYVPVTLDMGLFLKLASIAQQGYSCGDAKIDDILQQILFGASVSNSENNWANESLRTDSVTHQHDSNFTQTNSSKSRTEENINTDFSTEPWSGAFTGEPDNITTPTSSSSRRTGSRTPNAQPRSATMDVPPASAPEPVPRRPWGSDAPQPQTAAGDVPFSERPWETMFADGSWAEMQPSPRAGSPVKAAATPATRKQSQGRRASKPANKGTPAAKQPPQPHVVDVDDTVEVQGGDDNPENGARLDDGDAMDIDSTPPSQNTTSAAKEARFVSVEPSAWHQQQQQRTQSQSSTQRKGSNAARTVHPASAGDGVKLNTNLDSFRNVPPFTTDSGAGLDNFADMSSTLPFKSQAAPTLPTEISIQVLLNLPQVPRVPVEPQNLTKATWKDYVHTFADYLKAFHMFNAIMIGKFGDLEKESEKRFKRGDAWVQAQGDTSGVFGQPEGYRSYLAEVSAGERAREYWNVGCDKHSQAVKDFDKMRERIRKLATDGMLKES